MTRKPSRLVLLGLCASLAPAVAKAQTVNLYTSREPALIKPVLDEFTRDTGVKVNVVFAQNGLEERIAAEGANSPADLLLTVDVSKLVQAVEMGITQPLSSPALTAAVPPAYRDAGGHWYAATLRARVVYASKDRVSSRRSPMRSWRTPSGRARSASATGRTPTTPRSSRRRSPAWARRRPRNG